MTTDSFELAMRFDAALSAYQRRAAGYLVHPIVDAKHLTIIAEIFGSRLSNIPSILPLYDRILNIVKLIERLTPAQRAELETVLEQDKKINPWRPMRGSQMLGFECAENTDVLLLAGGGASGKSDLAIGIALFQSRNARIVRKTSLEFNAIYKRLSEVIGSTTGRNMSSQVWELGGPLYGFKQGGVILEFNSLAEPESMLRLQGRAVDTLIVDDVGSGQIPKSDIDFISRWLRSTEQIQKRLVYTSNPPSSINSLWIREAFGPWLSSSYAGEPAKSGEKRYFLIEGDSEREVEAGTPGAESRCVVMSTVHDNPRLVHTGYVEHLKRSPTEVLRKRLLENSWDAGWTEDDAMQVIPSAWIEAAINRWQPTPPCALQAIGVDVARGGKDRTTISRRHGEWFNAPKVYKGTLTPDGQAVAALVLGIYQKGAVCYVDVTGVGSSPTDLLKEKIPTSAIVFGAGTDQLDVTQSYGFSNVRSLLWWRFREALDPSRNSQIALPPDTLLKQELCMPHYELRGGKLFVEDRDSIIKRLKRSPDIATAFVLALIPTDSILNISNSFTGILQKSNAAWEQRMRASQ